MRHYSSGWCASSRLARAVGDAVRDAGDPRDVFVIVGAGAGDQRGRTPEHVLMARSSAAMTGESSGVSHGMHDHQVAQLEAHAVAPPRPRVDQRRDLRLRRVEPFFDQEPPIEHGPAEIGDARRLDAVDRLAAVDAVDVDRRVPRTVAARPARRSCATRAPASARGASCRARRPCRRSR